MNLGIRAILYSARKWKKTLLVFFLLLAITTLVLSGLAIADAQEEQAEEVRGTTGASFTVERNLSTGGWASEKWRLVQHTGVYFRRDDPGNCIGGRPLPAMMLPPAVCPS